MGAADDSVERSRLDSQARCDELGRSCGGFTCDAAAHTCTIRASTTLRESPEAEVSFLKAARQGAQQPSPERGNHVFQFYTGSQSVVHKSRIRAWNRSTLQ